MSEDKPQPKVFTPRFGELLESNSDYVKRMTGIQIAEDIATKVILAAFEIIIEGAEEAKRDKEASDE